MNRDPFETGGIYHIYNRGTDKRVVFLDHGDRVRFLDNLYEFNDEHPAANWRQKESPEVRPREKLVEIISYCLMPNHFHLMVRQIQDGGITLFMRKLGTGYTMYFNKKYDRSGALFQGKFKSVFVDKDVYLKYLPHYIHLNPSELPSMDWRNYRWSSCGAFLDSTNKPLLLDLDFIDPLYEPMGYKISLEEWARDKENLAQISGLILD